MYVPNVVQCKCNFLREDGRPGSYAGLLGNFIGSVIDHRNDDYWKMQFPARAAIITHLVEYNLSPKECVSSSEEADHISFLMMLDNVKCCKQQHDLNGSVITRSTKFGGHNTGQWIHNWRAQLPFWDRGLASYVFIGQCCGRRILSNVWLLFRWCRILACIVLDCLISTQISTQERKHPNIYPPY